MGTPAQVDHHPLVLFDGVCNLCNAAVLFVIRRDPRGKIKFASLQSDVGSSILQSYGLQHGNHHFQSIILIEKDKAYTRSTAALRAARYLNKGWPLLYAFLIVPKFIRDFVYDWIARNRYRFFGKRDACMIPTPELKSRFLGA